MRNYNRPSRLRHDEKPELQWLEDSINMMLNIAFTSVCELCRITFWVLGRVFSALFTKR
jgi:hypothetical protein